MQTAYDMWHAGRKIDQRKIPTLTVAILVEPLIERPRRKSPDKKSQSGSTMTAEHPINQLCSVEPCQGELVIDA